MAGPAIFGQMERREEFLAWASNPARTNDELFTLELLFERACHHKEFPFDSPEYQEQAARKEARRLNPAYRSSLTSAQLATVAEFSAGMTFFTSDSGDRPVRDLQALEFFPGLKSVSLSPAEVADYSPLARLPLLQSLWVLESWSSHSNLLESLESWGAMEQLEILSLNLNHPWPDLRPLATWSALRQFSYSGNLFALAEVAALPRVEVAALKGDSSFGTPLRDLRSFPAMPRVERLTLGPTDSLEGIARYPALLNLEVTGTFRDLSPLAALSGVSSLTLEGERFTKLEPLLGMPALRELKMKRELPIDLSALTDAPALREVSMERCPIMQTELAALNGALALAECEFAAPEPRPLGRLWFVVYNNEEKADQEFHQSLQRELEAARETYYRGDLARRSAEGRWIGQQVQERLDDLLGRGWGVGECTIEIRRYADVLRMGEVIQTLREISAAARFPQSFWLHVYPNGDMTYIIEQMERREEAKRNAGRYHEREFDAEVERQNWEYSRRRWREEHEYLDRAHRLRIQQEEGAPIDPADFSAPPEPVEADAAEDSFEADAAEVELSERWGEELEFHAHLFEKYLVVNQHWCTGAAAVYGEEPVDWRSL